MYGIVTGIKLSLKNNYYFLISDIENNKNFLNLKTDRKFQIGDKIQIEDLAFESICDKKILNKIIEKKSDDFLLNSIVKNKYTTTIKEIETVVENITPKLFEGCKLLLNKIISGTPIIIRFHNDADGSSASYAIFLGIKKLLNDLNIDYEPNITWIMQKSVTYGLEDAFFDSELLSKYRFIEKPLLIIMDFGTSLESNNSIKKTLEYFDILWMDHHPIEKGFEVGSSLYINPWLFGGDSNVTAGLISCIFTFLLSGIKLKEIENASLIGDYSSYKNIELPGNDLSTILDLITSDPNIIKTSRNKTLVPSDIEELLLDKQRYSSLLSFAKLKMDEYINLAVKNIKVYNSKNMRIYLSDFSAFRDYESRYPLPGRFSSKLLDFLSSKNEKPCILLLHFGVYISIRIDKNIAEKINILEIITKIKEEDEYIDSGGGHISAASIKLSELADKKEYIKKIIELIRAKDV